MFGCNAECANCTGDCRSEHIIKLLLRQIPLSFLLPSDARPTHHSFLYPFDAIRRKCDALIDATSEHASRNWFTCDRPLRHNIETIPTGGGGPPSTFNHRCCPSTQHTTIVYAFYSVYSRTRVCSYHLAARVRVVFVHIRRVRIVFVVRISAALQYYSLLCVRHNPGWIGPATMQCGVRTHVGNAHMHERSHCMHR